MDLAQVGMDLAQDGGGMAGRGLWVVGSLVVWKASGRGAEGGRGAQGGTGAQGGRVRGEMGG